MACHHAAVGDPGEGGALREIGSGRWRRILPHCLSPCSCARRGQVSLAALAAGGPASDHHIGSGARARERPPWSIRRASPPEVPVDRESVVSGKSVSVRVDLGGGRTNKKIKRR